MGRGFLGGVLLGGVSAVAIAAVISVMAPLPTPPEVGPAQDVADGPAPEVREDETATVVIPADADKAREAEAEQTAARSDAAPVSGGFGSQVVAPSPDSLAALEPDTTAVPVMPETGVAADLAPVAPSAGTDNQLPQADTPVSQNAQAAAPQAPQDPDDLSISTEPAQPLAPPIAEAESAFDDPAIAEAAPQDSADAEAALPEPEGETAPVDEAASVAPAQDVEGPEGSEPDAETVTTVEATPQDDARSAAAEDGPRVLPQTEVTIPDTPQVENDRPLVGRPARSLLEGDETVVVNRLPTTEDANPGAAPLAEEDDGSSTGETAPESSRDPEDTRPVSRYAVDFTAEPDKPLMAIVLMDTGRPPAAGEAGLAALRSFPYPVSFAVDPDLPDAEERMRAYREEGFEVLALIDLPEGGKAADAETTLGVSLPRLPEVVGVLEGTEAGLQTTRDAADQVAEILRQTGHGLVTQDKGLNTMPKLARKAGVPAAHVFRDFDSKDQTPTVIRRFLDQAAFKARQEGAVVMLGRLRPETISALLLWGLQDRASQVTLAPISTVLLRD